MTGCSRTKWVRSASLLTVAWLALPATARASAGPEPESSVPNAVSPPLAFYSVTPCRVVDTRLSGGPLVAGVERAVPTVGVCSIPSNAAAVSINVAVTQPTAAGNVRLYPAGSPVPTSSSINYAAGQTRTNNTVVGLGDGGALAARNQPTGSTHLIIDVNGYFADACVDVDGDGWPLCDGDCDDNNTNVNPGAFEVPADGVDNDCDTVVDETAVACDIGLASNSSEPLDYARAMDLCQMTTANPPIASRVWGVISAQLQLANGTGTPDSRSRAIRPNFGTGNVPLFGSAFLNLSTGTAAAPGQTNPAHEAFQTGMNAGTTSGFPPDWYAANGNQLPAPPGCPAPTGALAQDPVMLKVRVRVPTNARSFSVSSKFFTSEYPEWICSTFNDLFVVLLDSIYNDAPANPSDKNLATYTTPASAVYPVGPNLAHGNTGLFVECVNGTVGCLGPVQGAMNTCTGVGGLIGTSLDTPDPGNCNANSLVGGGTAWLSVRGNVVPGETIDLRFAIWDTSDHFFDSLVLLDNFRWSTGPVTPGTVLQ